MIIPQHIAIIMDGNGRWATSKNKPRTTGHFKGTENVRNIAIAAKNLGVKVLTLYAFSTENWKRPIEEVNYLMSLPSIFIGRYLDELMKNDIKITTIGDLSKLPKETIDVLKRAIDMTKNNKTMTLVFALNYGGRWDIVNAVNNCIKDGVKDIKEEDIDKYVSTSDFPAIDLMIRTSLDYRLSNFLMWQLAYSELYFVDCYWPDFDEKQLLLAIEQFNNRNRRFGGL